MSLIEIEMISQEVKKDALKSEVLEIVPGIVTDRDLAALQFVSEQGCMTVDQFWRAIWWSKTSRGPRYAYERILFLERSGFLEKMKTPYSLKSYFKASKKAYSLISSRLGEGSLTPTQKTPLNETLHVDTLTEIRIAATQAGKVKSWMTDRMMLSDPHFPRERFEITVPDAIWTLSTSQKKVAVEYERTRKGWARVRAKVDAYARELLRYDRKIDLVLWIAAPGSYRDLKTILVNHPHQKLRTFQEFESELESS